MEATISCKQDSLDLSRISLRRIDLSYLDDLMEWATDEKVTKFCSWEPYTSKQEAIDFIISIPRKFSWYRLICLDKKAIGAVSVCLYAGSDKGRARTAEIGYVFNSRFWGKGIATHVVKEVSKIIFDEYPELLRLEALTDVENVGSQRVLEKAGFQREGVLRNYLFMKGKSRDMVIFSLLPADLRT